MKTLLKFKTSLIAKLLVTLTVFATSTVAAADGGTHGGGGFYGKVNGQWILLDDLEEGMILDQNKEPFRTPLNKVEAKVAQVAIAAPKFAQELLLPLQKTWHLVDFELSCEDPKSVLKIDQFAGACQDDNDVFIERAKYEAASPEQLILHELVQGVRLKKNSSPYTEKQISAGDVRAIKRAISRELFKNEIQFVLELKKYNFGSYLTGTENKADLHRQGRVQEKNKIIDEAIKKAKSAAAKNCSFISSTDTSTPETFANYLSGISKTRKLISDALHQINLVRFDYDFGSDELRYLNADYAELESVKVRCEMKEDLARRSVK